MPRLYGASSRVLGPSRDIEDEPIFVSQPFEHQAVARNTNCTPTAFGLLSFLLLSSSKAR